MPTVARAITEATPTAATPSAAETTIIATIRTGTATATATTSADQRKPLEWR